MSVEALKAEGRRYTSTPLPKIVPPLFCVKGSDSDYDVAVFLRDLADRWQEFDRLADLTTDILDKTGEFIHAIPYRAGSSGAS